MKKNKIGFMVVLLLLMINVSVVDAKVTKSQIKEYTRKTMYNKYGWGNEEYNALVKIIDRESSWNHKAVNKKSKACGLFQALPCKKMRTHGKDYKTNFKTQVKWGLNYIKNRYGSPTKAWEFWQTHHWY